jgi:predicted ATPase
MSARALVLWLLGAADQALRQMQEALAVARQLEHPLTLTHTLSWAAMFHKHRREVAAAQTCTEAAMALARQHGFTAWEATNQFLHAWLQVVHGQAQEGIAGMHQAIAAWEALGATLARPRKLLWLAEVYGSIGQADTGLRLLEEALCEVEHTGERVWDAELHRLRGDLLLDIVQPADAETCWQRVLAVARGQHAKVWELRAAMSLARLWQRQRRRVEARSLLTSTYHWFTEGFDTPDLQEARALLDELG